MVGRHEELITNTLGYAPYKNKGDAYGCGSFGSV